MDANKKNEFLELIKEGESEELKNQPASEEAFLKVLFTEKKKKVEPPKPKQPDPQPKAVPPHLQEFKQQMKKLLEQVFKDLD